MFGSGNFRKMILLVSFPLQYGNETIPVWREIGMGFSRMSGEATNAGRKNSLRITNGTFPISHEWLSRRDEIKIPHERRSRE